MANIPNTADLISEIDIILEGANGEHVYSNEKALYGYIDIAKALFLPIGLTFNDPTDIDLEVIGKRDGQSQITGINAQNWKAANNYVGNAALSNIEITQVTLMNYIKLKRANLTNEGAFLAASLRARWVHLGCLYDNIVDRGTPFDETVRLDTTDPDVGDIVAATSMQDIANSPQFANIRAEWIALSRSPTFGQKFVTQYADTIWCMSELMFRIRGHHWKPEYNEILQRVFRANCQGAMELPPTFPFEAVFHTAIHPFGVKALPVKAAHFMRWGKVGNTMYIRFSGAPNGTAVFTTISAGLRVMASEPWYEEFEKRFTNTVNTIHDFANQILDNKYAYHLSAGLYGLNRKTTLVMNGVDISLSEAESLITGLAPMVHGFSSAMNNVVKQFSNVEFAFGKQQVLSKRAGNNPLHTVKMARLIEVIVEKIQSVVDTDELIRTIGGAPNETAKVQAQNAALLALGQRPIP